MTNMTIKKQVTIYNYICVKCGTHINGIEGSLKHPYCKKCFKKIFNNNYDKYFDFFRLIWRQEKI